MYKVEQKADNLKDGITNMMLGAKNDYIRMSTSGGKELTGYSKEQVDNWDNKTKVSEGKKYIKIVQDTGVFAFVMKEDSGRFKKGDILKAAGYNKPALNSARGNVLTGNNNSMDWSIVLKIRRTTMWKKVNEYITIIMATIGTLAMVGAVGSIESDMYLQGGL